MGAVGVCNALAQFTVGFYCLGKAVLRDCGLS